MRLCEEDSPEEETTQQPAAQAAAQGRPAAGQHIQAVTEAILVMTPGFKEIEQRRKVVLRVCLEVLEESAVAVMGGWRSGSGAVAGKTGKQERRGTHLTNNIIT